MGKRLVEFPLQEGGSVLVEVEDDVGGDGVTRGWGDTNRRGGDQAQQNFEQAGGGGPPGNQGLLTPFRSGAGRPGQIPGGVGLQLSAEGGGVGAGGRNT